MTFSNFLLNLYSLISWVGWREGQAPFFVGVIFTVHILLLIKTVGTLSGVDLPTSLSPPFQWIRYDVLWSHVFNFTQVDNDGPYWLFDRSQLRFKILQFEGVRV